MNNFYLTEEDLLALMYHHSPVREIQMTGFSIWYYPHVTIFVIEDDRADVKMLERQLGRDQYIFNLAKIK